LKNQSDEIKEHVSLKGENKPTKNPEKKLDPKMKD
jgi:hypothetical protein